MDANLFSLCMGGQTLQFEAPTIIIQKYGTCKNGNGSITSMCKIKILIHYSFENLRMVIKQKIIRHKH
jgi:hypothetical protein